MNDEIKNTSDALPMPGKWQRRGFLLLAYITTGFGIAGVFLPLLPTTPFLLIAIWAASKGSQRIHDWIYAQPRFARLINDWHEQRAVPLSAKWLATAMMATSLAILIATNPHWLIVLGLSLFFMAVGTFLWSRPNPQ